MGNAGRRSLRRIWIINLNFIGKGDAALPFFYYLYRGDYMHECLLCDELIKAEEEMICQKCMDESYERVIKMEEEEEL